MPVGELYRQTEVEDHPDVKSLAYSAEKLFGRLFELAHEPVGGDQLLAYAAKGMAMHLFEDPTLLRVFHEARLERSARGAGLTSISGALLMLAHGVNKIYFDQGIYNYPEVLWEVLGLNDPEQTSPELYKALFADIQRNHLDKYAEIIRERNIQSTDFHRGISLPSIIHRMFGSNGITWTTIGSSAGIPDKRVAYADRFKGIDTFSVVDQTTYRGDKGIVMGAVDKPIQVDRLIAVDPTNPLAKGDTDAQSWFVSCRMPSKATINEVNKTKERMILYADDELPGYEFREGLMDAPPVDRGTCDLVTAFTVLTHMDKAHRDNGIDAMLSLLKPDDRSLLVIQDYMLKDGGSHGISTVKTREPFSYGTWVCGAITGWEMWEVYKFQNSECRGIVVPGEDFIRFMESSERFQ